MSWATHFFGPGINLQRLNKTGHKPHTDESVFDGRERRRSLLLFAGCFLPLSLAAVLPSRCVTPSRTSRDSSDSRLSCTVAITHRSSCANLPSAQRYLCRVQLAVCKGRTSKHDRIRSKGEKTHTNSWVRRWRDRSLRSYLKRWFLKSVVSLKAQFAACSPPRRRPIVYSIHRTVETRLLTVKEVRSA